MKNVAAMTKGYRKARKVIKNIEEQDERLI